MSDSTVVQLDVQDKIATIRICRASSLNALNVEVLRALRARLEELHTATEGEKAFKEVRVLLLCSEGEKAFVAGADIKHMQQASRAEREEFVALGQGVMNAVELLPLPVIAVVQGFALGGGMELALSADIIVASSSASFGQPEVNLGLIPGFGGTQRLVARCGAGHARRMILTGESISAEEAYRIGLVDYLAGPEELAARAQRVAETLVEIGYPGVRGDERVRDEIVGC